MVKAVGAVCIDRHRTRSKRPRRDVARDRGSAPRSGKNGYSGQGAESTTERSFRMRLQTQA